MLRGAAAKPRERIRAHVLLLSDKGWSVGAIVDATGASSATIGRIRRQYDEEGLDMTLTERARPGGPRKLTEHQRQAIVATVCTAPPEGFARWSLRLLTQEVHRRRIVDSASRELIRVVLRDHELRPWREKNVVRT